MKSYDELYTLWDSLGELPLSEETLCAYAEGTLSDEENALVGRYLADSPDTAQLLHDFGQLETDELAQPAPEELEELELPELPGDTHHGDSPFDTHPDGHDHTPYAEDTPWSEPENAPYDSHPEAADEAYGPHEAADWTHTALEDHTAGADDGTTDFASGDGDDNAPDDDCIW